MGHYPEQISRKLYEATPKAVFAGIAAGVAINGAVSLDRDDTPDTYIAREWVLMHAQKLVEQVPPAWVRALARKDKTA